MGSNRTRNLLLVTAFVIAVVLMFFFKNSGEENIKYKTAKISLGRIKAVCTATGTVNPLTTVLVGTQVSGRIKSLYADFNSPVKKGQLIAEIDPAMFEAQLEQARANLISARANLKKTKASCLETERDLNRKKELLKNKIIGDSEFDAAETNYVVAKSQVGVAEAQVVQTEAAFKYSKTNLRYTKIVSPVDGIVISRNVDVGQTVAATFQTPTLFTIAKDLRKMQINTNVDEADIGKIEVAQDVEFTVDAYPYTVFKGTVSQIRNAPIVSQNVVTYDVIVKVDNVDLKLKPGMTANVSIVVSVKNDVLRIPSSALRFRPKDADYDALKNVQRVWVVKKGHPECIEVKTGIDDYSWSELVTGDLADKQEVITGYFETGRK